MGNKPGHCLCGCVPEVAHAPVVGKHYKKMDRFFKIFYNSLWNRSKSHWWTFWRSHKGPLLGSVTEITHFRGLWSPILLFPSPCGEIDKAIQEAIKASATQPLLLNFDCRPWCTRFWWCVVAALNLQQIRQSFRASGAFVDQPTQLEAAVIVTHGCSHVAGTCICMTPAHCKISAISRDHTSTRGP